MINSVDLGVAILTGADLRIYLNSEHVTYGEIHSLLKRKGVFVGDSEKSITVPLLSAALLTPDEFESLIKSAVSRESRLKNKPFYGCMLMDKDADWVTVLRNNFTFNVEQLVVKLGNIEFVSCPEVFVENSSKVLVPYEIFRKDYSKDFLQRELKFKGEIVVEREDGELKLSINSTHSSNETEVINKMLVKKISSVLIDAGLISDAVPKQILFSEFSNEERVRFFKRLTAGVGRVLTKGSVSDIDIMRDIEFPVLLDDPQIAWMGSGVKRLKVDGDRLNEVFLIADEKYYHYYHILKLDVEFEYKDGPNSGVCKACFYFNNSKRNDMADAELVYECVRVSHNNTVNAKSINSIKQNIEKGLFVLVEQKYKQFLSEKNK